MKDEEENNETNMKQQANELAAFYSKFFLERLDKALDLHYHTPEEESPPSGEQND